MGIPTPLVVLFVVLGIATAILLMRPGYQSCVRWIKSEATVSKIGFLFWVVIAAFIWADMITTDVNNFIDTVGSAVFLYYLMMVLRLYKPLTARGIGLYVMREMEDKHFQPRIALGAFCAAISTAFFYSALLDGSWPGVSKVTPSACFGWFHLHHWQWYLAATGFFLYIFGFAHERKKIYSKRAFHISFVLLGVAVFYLFVHGWSFGESVFWIVFCILSFLSFMIGLALRYDKITSRWFYVFMCMNLGVAAGGGVQGIIGIIQDNYSPLIYVDTDVCSRGTRIEQDARSNIDIVFPQSVSNELY